MNISDASGGAQKEEIQNISQPDINGRSFDVIQPKNVQKSSTSSIMDSDNIDEKVSTRFVE